LPPDRRLYMTERDLEFADGARRAGITFHCFSPRASTNFCRVGWMGTDSGS
jgi:hypothetical protein